MFYGLKIKDEFDNERNPPSNSRVTGPERVKIAVFNLVRAIEINLDQSCTKCFNRYKISDEFDNDRNPPCNAEAI